MRQGPGLQLKEKVRTGAMTPQDALTLLCTTDPVHAKATKTYRWLLSRGAR